MPDTWKIGPISEQRLHWGMATNDHSNDRRCPVCRIELLTGEKPGFCCGSGGDRFDAVQPLPPLPEEFAVFLRSPDISRLSRKLNLIFSFAAMESSHAFPTLGNPSFIAVAGRIYHRIRAGPEENTAIRWMLYDGFDYSKVPHRTQAREIPSLWIRTVQDALSQYNPLTKEILSMRSLSHQDPDQFTSAQIVVRDSGFAEIAAVMNYESSLQSGVRSRVLTISTTNNRRQKVHNVSRLWEPLAYPLFFPHGTLGWGLKPSRDEIVLTDNPTNPNAEPSTTQIWHYRAHLLRKPRFEIFGRLTNEYTVDMFTRELESRLAYVRDNQERIRNQAQDAALMGSEEVSEAENVYLPASFLGSARWSSSQIADSLTLAAKYGPPTFFVTFTCNGEWPEIQLRLRPGQTYADIPVVVCRVFKQKLSRLMSVFRTMFPNAGGLLYNIKRIEFQKRGLPHAHILLKYAKECLSPDDIDCVVSAHIPDAADDAAIVRRFMIHPAHPSTIISNVPPSPENPLKYCEKWKDGARMCRFGYPKPAREETSFDSANRVLYRREQEDSFVVPHCLPLLRKFQCHMNMEVAGSGHLFQYLFKYIHKGPDRAKFQVRPDDENDAGGDSIDEIDEYWSGRYLSATEAVWRIFGYHVTQKNPSVTSLPVHLPDSLHHQRYKRSNPSPTLSKLEHYFARPTRTFFHEGSQRGFQDVHYVEYFTIFRTERFNLAKAGKPGVFLENNNPRGAPKMHVIQRSLARRHLTRIQSIHVSRGELFYLRSLLLSRPARSWEELRVIDGTLHSSFQAACIALGLFADKDEAQVCMQEAVDTLRTPNQLRLLFVHLLTNSCINTPLELWEDFRSEISEDFILALADAERGCNEALKQLGSLLQGHGKHLNDYGLPQPLTQHDEAEWELRRWSPQSLLLQQQTNAALSTFNREQRDIFLRVQHAILVNEPLSMFIDGKAGRGKTFLVDTLCAWVRSTEKIALPTATSAFAAQLYPGGRTTHSTFGVPVNDGNEFLESTIDPRHQRAELIRRCSLIVWDEAPMANRAVLACVEECCRRVMGNNLLFGGKVVILLGDFRQTCPVVPRGTKTDIINASITRCSFWSQFTIARLITLIRNAEDPALASFVDEIGDGAGPHVNLSFFTCTMDTQDVINFVYGQGIVNNPTACLRRSILAPTNAQVDQYNTVVLALLPSTPRQYHAADSLEEHDEVTEAMDSNADNSSTLPNPDAVLDYVRNRRPSGMPDYNLTVKIGGVYRLLRNFSIEMGLVKNVRVVVTGMGPKLIAVRILNANTQAPVARSEADILLPRITFKDRLYSGHTLCRRQFPLAPAYASTFHSCQGLTLDRIGVDLSQDVFTHGQLYTALSRIRRRADAIVRLPTLTDLTTVNVTYKDILI